jgi:hypothetical protein
MIKNAHFDYQTETGSSISIRAPEHCFGFLKAFCDLYQRNHGGAVHESVVRRIVKHLRHGTYESLVEAITLCVSKWMESREKRPADVARMLCDEWKHDLEGIYKDRQD